MIQAWNIIVCIYKVDMDIHMQIFSFISHAFTYYGGCENSGIEHQHPKNAMRIKAVIYSEVIY